MTNKHKQDIRHVYITPGFLARFIRLISGCWPIQQQYNTPIVLNDCCQWWAGCRDFFLLRQLYRTRHRSQRARVYMSLLHWFLTARPSLSRRTLDEHSFYLALFIKGLGDFKKHNNILISSQEQTFLFRQRFLWTQFLQHVETFICSDGIHVPKCCL